MTTMTEQALTTQVYSVFIKATPEQVWDAITKPEFTEQYFYGQRIEISAEGRTWINNRGELVTSGPIAEWDPPRRLVHGWRSMYDPEMAAEDESRVTWEIAPQEDGTTLLTVVHDKLDGAPKTAQSVSGTGWMLVLSGLKTLLETGERLA
ncbi:MAG: SRPBCC family protein [Actinomycetota bacterium]